jgi:hypothetical protein
MASLDRHHRIMVFPLVLLGILLTLTGCIPTGSHSMGPSHVTHRMGRAAPRCSVPAGLPGTVVRVALMDMAHRRMMRGNTRMTLRASPPTVPTGRVTFVASDLGSRRHELVVLPLDNRQNFGQRASGDHGKVLERGALGEASRPCGAGVGAGLRPGTTGVGHPRPGPGPLRADLQRAAPLPARHVRRAGGVLSPRLLRLTPEGPVRGRGQASDVEAAARSAVAPDKR